MGKINKLDRFKIVESIAGKKPERQYKNFGHYILTTRGECQNCHGAGRVVAPGERPDVYEGHKMSRRINCPKCEGTGRATSKMLTSYYAKTVSNFNTRMHKWREDRAKIEKAILSLSREDAKVLKLL
ncbi:putative heat shock domain-containing protein [Rhizobium phage RHph_TM39]|uniref:Putative heat shock domain-containing protein n=1 Tax=Rhizobium phage RHph_TM30 TaxID=2509764 RepID=A0A7S5R534_9CAUD|nr:putative heat shock domain-containing protein [Rhizobium phage RHph_TM30]QIG71656.1 putative heat shock domain-containing protein [Rhizobium phage RHph_TM40]QIG72019.1 putative heat shock domain-containing protein [Rhizobium phage RHph_TM2_3B]QIG72382.1 putative heat shock domain-containing protein [Rhizobium phage RHph_TM3_3_6]QIG77173.1 putative heat shock domain-containing protein [Rhizobium phage RHph_TM39]QIG71293.1 putative heat shock domain-containing protein [Rhizobium phage RHph_TM